MAEIDYDRLTQSIAQGIAGNVTQNDSQSDRDRLRSLLKDLDKFKSSLKNNSEAAARLSDIIKDNSLQYKDVSSTLNDLQKAIGNTENAEERRLLNAKKRDLEMAVGWEYTKRASATFARNLVSTGTQFANSLIGTSKDIINNLIQNSSDTRLFSNLFSSSIKILTGVAGAAGQMFGNLGGVIGNLVSIMFPRFGKVLGSLTEGLGKLFGSVIGIIGSVASQAVEIIFQQIETYARSFNTLNRAGAVFAGGLGDMLNTAHEGGLTLEQFSRVVSENSQNIASAGLGVTEGSRKLSKSLAQGGIEMQRRLMSLGYNVEEQAGLVAETMSRMAGLAGPLKASDREVAVQTEKYAQNLRLISSITGEDARKKMEAARQDLLNFRFQQQLNKLGQAQRDQVDQAFKTAPEAARKMAVEIANTGTIITPALAAFANISPEIKRLAEMLAEGARTGNISVKEVVEYLGENSDTIRQGLQKQESLATAAFARPDNQVLAEIARLSLGMLETVSKYTKDGVKAALANLDKGGQAADTDPLTNALVTIQQRAQELRVLVEEKISKLMHEFAQALTDNVNTIADGLKKLADSLDIKGVGGTISNVLERVNEVLGGLFNNFDKILEKLTNLTMTKDTAGTVGGVVGAGVGGTVGGVVGAGVGSKLGQGLVKEAGSTVTKTAVKKVTGAALGSVGALLGGGIGSVITGGAGYLLGDYIGEKIYDAFFQDTEKRASGGPINKNIPYIVGEQGPELRIFEKDGSIVPTNTFIDLLRGTSNSLTSFMYDMQRSVNSQTFANTLEKFADSIKFDPIMQFSRTFTNTLEEFAISLTRFVNNLSNLIIGLEIPRNTQIGNVENMLTALMNRDFLQVSMPVAVSSIDQQNFLDDFRNVMSETTNIINMLKTASMNRELSQVSMPTAKSSIDQQNFLDDFRNVMSEITNSAINGSEKAVAEISAQLGKTVSDLMSATTMTKDTNVVDLTRTMQDQYHFQETSMRQQYEMLSVLNEMRSIQQQILSIST
jgi:hypothetical protein